MTNHRPKSTWIIVVQRAEATIFSSRGSNEPMTVVAAIDNPRGRMHGRDIDSDRPGRSFDRGGHGRHALVSEEPLQEHVEREFARGLAERLDRERCAGTFDQLIVFAASRMLGHLREALTEPTRHMVRVEIIKELLRPTPVEIREHLHGLAGV